MARCDQIRGATSRSYTVLFTLTRNAEQHTEGMLCSLIRQLANSLIAVPEVICGLWEKYKGKKARPSPEELLGVLTFVVREYFRESVCSSGCTG